MISLFDGPVVFVLVRCAIRKNMIVSAAPMENKTVLGRRPPDKFERMHSPKCSPLEAFRGHNDRLQILPSLQLCIKATHYLRANGQPFCFWPSAWQTHKRKADTQAHVEDIKLLC